MGLNLLVDFPTREFISIQKRMGKGKEIICAVWKDHFQRFTGCCVLEKEMPDYATVILGSAPGKIFLL